MLMFSLMVSEVSSSKDILYTTTTFPIIIYVQNLGHIAVCYIKKTPVNLLYTAVWRDAIDKLV